jgi:peptidase inhibitor family I36
MASQLPDEYSEQRKAMREHRRTNAARSLIAAVACTTALIATAGPATAADAGQAASQGDCPFTDTLCLFEGEDFTGERFTLTATDPAGSCVGLARHGWDNRARSAINTSATSAALFANEDCTGGPYQVPGGTSLATLGTFTPVSVWGPG